MKTKKLEKEYLRSFFRGNRLLWAAVMGLTVLGALYSLSVSWLLKEAFDVISTRELDRLVWLAKVGSLLILSGEGVDLLCCRLRARFLQRSLRQYKAFAFSRLTRKSISAFSRENTARYISVLTNDIEHIEAQYLRSSFEIVQLFLVAAGSAVMIFYYGGPLAWICLGISAIPVVLSILMSGEMSRRTTAVSDQNEHFVAQVKDLLTGFSVLKSFKAEKEAGQLFDRSNEKTEQIKLRNRWWQNLMATMQGFCSMLLQLGVVFAAGYLAITGDVTPGVAVVMVNLCGQLVNPISQLPQCCGEWKAARDLVVKMAAVAEENAVQTGEPIDPVLREAITLENLTFGYEENKPVLKNLDISFESGKKYAIVGTSGSGKSTLLNLLMGGYPGYEGSIRIDGKELKSIQPDSLYDLMSLIGQNVFLFDSTIRENITMFRDFPAEAVSSAAERAGLLPVMAAKGADYRCGENGQDLSGGEGQRVSIARALLRGTPVLMLDEATAALDNQTAFEVTDAILHLDGLTRIVVTHRLEEGLLKQYDDILVLRDGCVTEHGTFEDLMARTGYFYSLYNVSN